MTGDKDQTPKSLLAREYPDGFDDDGRRLVAECDEFTIYELWKSGGELIVERSSHVERSLFACFFRIYEDRESGKSTTKDERLSWAITMLRLAAFTRTGDDGFSKMEYGQAPPIFGTEGKGGGGMACRVAHTIGRRLLSLHDTPRDRVDSAIEDCAALFKGALRAYAAYCGLLPDGRMKQSGSSLPREAQIVLEAERIFFETHVRPSKQAIRSALEARGFFFTGKDQKGKWEAAFMKAGLGNLPDSPAS